MADEPLTVCPDCGAYIRRVLYPAGIVFKGSGFYKTDYSKNKSIPPSSNGNGETGESKKADGATESKTSSESKPSENGSSSNNTSSTSESKASTSATKQ
jgi:predicted nucleic acid-binding Zn ribbon protein